MSPCRVPVRLGSFSKLLALLLVDVTDKTSFSRSCRGGVASRVRPPSQRSPSTEVAVGLDSQLLVILPMRDSSRLQLNAHRAKKVLKLAEKRRLRWLTIPGQFPDSSRTVPSTVPGTVPGLNFPDFLKCHGNVKKKVFSL